MGIVLIVFLIILIAKACANAIINSNNDNVTLILEYAYMYDGLMAVPSDIVLKVTPTHKRRQQIQISIFTYFDQSPSLTIYCKDDRKAILEQLRGGGTDLMFAIFRNAVRQNCAEAQQDSLLQKWEDEVSNMQATYEIDSQIWKTLWKKFKD